MLTSHRLKTCGFCAHLYNNLPNDKDTNANLPTYIIHNIHNNNYFNLSKNNKWILYNILGLEESKGVGKFKLTNEAKIFIKNINNFTFKDIYVLF